MSRRDGLVVRRTKEPKVLCDACHYEHVADRLWPTLCRRCAGKLRAIDSKMGAVEGIRQDMRNQDLL
jgi:hypothetical protein